MMILLADERDLRQLPPELDGRDGVRLMTVHASKGLEFEAVHLPGLFAGALPAANRPPICPPPVGMIALAGDDDAHEAEEECILFVALSRAKRSLTLYRPLKRNGRNANASRFLARVPVTVGHAAAPVGRMAPIAALLPIHQPAAPAALTAADIERYTGCPRRFFYERVLGLARRSRTGAYLDAHGCLQAVIAYAKSLGPGVPYDRGEAERIFIDAWDESGLEANVFGPAYRRHVTGMLDRLHVAAAGAAARPNALSTTIGGETVAALADRIFDENGATIVRNLRSGKQSATHADSLSATILLKATGETIGSQTRIENHYLLGGGVLEVSQTTAKFSKRLTDCDTAVGDIRAGRFDTEKSDFQCPRCPYLFVCPSPDGTVPA